jgi:hypothetical protein
VFFVHLKKLKVFTVLTIFTPVYLRYHSIRAGDQDKENGSSSSNQQSKIKDEAY